MHLKDILGETIKDIRCIYVYENEYGLQEFQSYIQLSSGLIFQIPYYPDAEIEETLAMDELFRKAREVDHRFLKRVKGQKIVDFYFMYIDNELFEEHKPYMQLENGLFLTELNYAPMGLTNVDMQILSSQDFEKVKNGLVDDSKFIRLTEM